jgi:hypothetical protein
MRLERSGEGFAVEAGDLGRLLDLDPGAVQGLMRAGAIRSVFERGEGEDAGRFRLTFTHGSRRVRLIVDAEGRVLQRSRTRTPPRRAGGSAGEGAGAG